MRAVLSTTLDSTYLFLMPLAVWSWKRIGVDSIVFWTQVGSLNHNAAMRLSLAFNACNDDVLSQRIKVDSYEKEATYAQVSRLYGCLVPEPDDDEVLITTDADMAVFGDYLIKGDRDRINVYGHDLVPEGQYPMCYVAMTKKKWREIMGVKEGQRYQEVLEEKLEPLACEHMRGNYWALDQETIFEKIRHSGLPVYGHSRANHPTQFATRRADRDGWPDTISPDLVDAHLPRPGYTEANFARILDLFQTMYPQDDFAWMVEYRNEYIKLL